MNANRRPTRITALLATAALVLTACSGSSSPSPSAAAASAAASAGGNQPSSSPAAQPSSSPAAAPVSLTIAANAVVGGKSDQEASWITNYVIPTFEKEMAAQGKNVTVQFNGTGVADEDYKAQLALDLKSGAGADVFDMDGIWIGEFAQANYIKPLTTVAGSDVDSWDGWAQIPTAVQDNMSFGGQRYGLSMGTDGRFLYFNKDVLAKAGLPADWQPKSWADIISAAQAIKAKVPGVTPLQIDAGTAMGEATTMQGVLPLLAGTGVKIYDETTQKWQGDTPNLEAVLSFYQQVYSSGLGDPQLQAAAKGRDQSFQLFSQQKIGILAESDYMWRGILNPTGGDFPMANRATEVGYVFMPAQNPGSGIRKQDYVSMSGGGGRVLNPNSKNPKEAWALLSFMASKDAVLAYVGKQPQITMRQDVNDATLSSDPLLLWTSQKVLPLTAYRPGFAVYPQVSQALQLATQEVVAGTPVASAAKEYNDTLVKLVGADHVASGG